MFCDFRVSTDRIRLGNLFDAAANVDGRADTITFAQRHNFRTGEQVVYNTGGGASISSDISLATNEAKLWVRVIDPRTIKLSTTQIPLDRDESADLASFSAVNDSTDTISVSNDFQDGDAVTYRAESAQFVGDAVDVNVVSRTVDNQTIIEAQRGADGSVVRNDAANNIFLPMHRFQSGDAVSYQGTGIGLNPGTYYVNRIDGNAIRLSTTRAGALAGTGIVALTAPRTGTHTLTRNLGGLQNGQTYYVIERTANSVKLAETPSGTALQVELTAEHGPANTHRIGKLGVDFSNGGGTGMQTLRIDLTSGGTGTGHKLVGSGGTALASVAPTTGGRASPAPRRRAASAGSSVPRFRWQRSTSIQSLKLTLMAP